MSWSLDVVDLAGNRRATLDSAYSLEVTPRLSDFASIKFSLNPRDEAAGEVLIGQRAIRAYQDGILRFAGKVWEPLSKGSKEVKVEARDPIAEFKLRRVRAQADYTATNNLGGPWDAGLITYDRLAVQNALRSTYLLPGNRQASVNRVRTAAIGTSEGDILDELTNASGGFFYVARPTDSTPGAHALLDIFYPSAGTNREEVRLGFGEDTLDNQTDYEQVEMLPLNRMTVASSAATGGRISKAAEDAASVALFGLFENETAFSDVSDLNLLQQQADASLKPTPPLTYTLTPGLDAPALFVDFNVGDFVRLNIQHGSVNVFLWVRVLEATLAVTENGIETLRSITVEVLIGDQLTTHPDGLFLAQRDEDRRRIEALERKVENMTVAVSTPTGSGTPSGGGGDVAPPEPPPPPPPPPPAPHDPPTVNIHFANGIWNEGESPGGFIEWDVDGMGQSVETWIWVQDGPLDGSGTPTGSIRNAGVHQSGDGTKQEKVTGLLRNHTYYVLLWASNASGTIHQGYTSFTTPSIQFA